MSKQFKTNHINDYPQDQLKGLCKQYYVRARKAEAKAEELWLRTRALENRLTILSGLADDMISAIER